MEHGSGVLSIRGYLFFHMAINHTMYTLTLIMQRLIDRIIKKIIVLLLQLHCLFVSKVHFSFILAIYQGLDEQMPLIHSFKNLYSALIMC